MKKYSIGLAICLLASGVGYGQALYEMPTGVVSKLSSFENPNGLKEQGGKTNQTAKGNAFEALKAGETKILLDVKGAGEIQRMWFTVQNRSASMLRSLRLQMYWDNAPKPAVDVPFGDFFGIGLGKTARFESELFSSPEGRSFNCYIPMPFRKAAKVLIVNESSQDMPLLFYDIDFVQRAAVPANALYFHAFWTRQRTTELGKDFEFLPKVMGKGRFLGLNMGVNAAKTYGNTWWGEGEVKMYLDGDTQHPSINGTGAEDYIGTGWGLGAFANRYQGCPIANDSTKEYAFYRYHVPDQIFFRRDFRGTIQQIGGGMRDYVRQLVQQGVALRPVSVQYEGGFRRLLDNPLALESPDFPNGWVNFYRIDDYSATSYFYLDAPMSNLPALSPLSSRVE